MKKQLTNTTNYEPNALTKVKVVNKPIIDTETGEQFGFDVKVTVSYKAGVRKDMLTFANSDELAEYIGNIDFDEPQQHLGI